MDRMTRAKKHGRRPARPSPGAASSGPAANRPGAARYWALAVGLSAVIVYLNAFGHDFVLDDTRIIQDNVRIRSLANIPALFASSYWGQSGTNALYRPLALATYAVNYAIHGLWTPGYTAVNVALHASVSLLVFGLVRGLGGSLLAAGIAGIVYAVHPVHTEAVTGMAGRPELLAALFFFLAMRFHRLTPGAGRRALVFRVAALASFACALLSKESAITLLLVLPLMDALVPARDDAGQPKGPGARLVLDYLPLAAVAIAYLAVRHAVLGGVAIAEDVIAPLDNPLVPVTTLPLGERLGATSGQAHHDGVRGDPRVHAAPRVARPPVARLLVQPDSARHEPARRPVPGRRDHRGGLHRRHRRAVAPQPDCRVSGWRCWRRRSPSSATSSSRSAPSAPNGSCICRAREPPSRRESRPRRSWARRLPVSASWPSQSPPWFCSAPRGHGRAIRTGRTNARSGRRRSAWPRRAPACSRNTRASSWHRPMRRRRRAARQTPSATMRRLRRTSRPR